MEYVPRDTVTSCGGRVETECSLPRARRPRQQRSFELGCRRADIQRMLLIWHNLQFIDVQVSKLAEYIETAGVTRPPEAVSPFVESAHGPLPWNISPRNIYPFKPDNTA